MSGQELVDELRRGDGNGCKHANDTMRRAADRIKALEARERGLVDQVNMFQMGNDRADERDAYAAVIAEARGVLRRASQGDQATRDAGMGRALRILSAA